jgi:hypothetical protein
MNHKYVIFLLLTVSAATFFSGCKSVESKSAEEVVFDNSKVSSEEVFITNADVKDENQQVKTTKTSGQLGKRLLADKSSIETILDGFGNKIETRHFSGHPRLRLLIVRTSVDGKREVTVYGNGGGTKMVAGLEDSALTASGDEIANAAQLYATPSYGASKNFMKGSNVQTQTPLQPLPSSAFQTPPSQVPQPVAPIQPEPSVNRETPAAQQNVPDED